MTKLKRVRVILFIVLYIVISTTVSYVTYYNEQLNLNSESVSSTLDMTETLSNVCNELLNKNLELVDIFARNVIAKKIDNEESYNEDIKEFEATTGLKIIVFNSNFDALTLKGRTRIENSSQLADCFKNDKGFMELDFNFYKGNGCSMFSHITDAKGNSYIVAGVYGYEKITANSLAKLMDDVSAVYFIDDKGNTVMNPYIDRNELSFDNIIEWAKNNAIHVSNANITNMDEGSLFFTLKKRGYSLSYSLLELNVNKNYYIIAINKANHVMIASNSFMLKIMLKWLGCLVIMMPFAFIYRRYEKTNKELVTAEDANEAKNSFLSKFSHDFRTPMNALIGMTELAKESIDNKQEMINCLNQIEISADYMLSMLTDILDIAKIEKRKIELVVEPFSMNTFVRSINSIMFVQAQSKNIRFLIKKKNSSDILIMGDNIRLKQIFVNLISNSIKFTRKGGNVLFEVEETMRTEKTVSMKFSVSDNGIGMSEKFMKKMYQPFEREKNYAGNVDGSGLGLAICYSLVRLMGGTISVTSKIGVGSKFTIMLTFPYVCEHPELVPKNHIKVEEKKYDFTGKHILLVDDSLTNLDIAKKLLNNVNAEVDTVTDGQQAVNRFLDSPIGSYDAIIMDVQMPVKNGLEAAMEIRQSCRDDAKTIKIAAMTANAFKEDEEQAISHGMNMRIIKPVKMKQLYDSLEKLLALNLK